MIDEKKLIEQIRTNGIPGEGFSDWERESFVVDIINNQPQIGEWIPCTERLPEENEDVEVTVEEDADEVGGKRYYNIRSWVQDGVWIIKKNPYHPRVIAWKYPAEPYRPEK